MLKNCIAIPLIENIIHQNFGTRNTAEPLLRLQIIVVECVERIWHFNRLNFKPWGWFNNNYAQHRQIQMIDFLLLNTRTTTISALTGSQLTMDFCVQKTPQYFMTPRKYNRNGQQLTININDIYC